MADTYQSLANDYKSGKITKKQYLDKLQFLTDKTQFNADMQRNIDNFKAIGQAGLGGTLITAGILTGNPLASGAGVGLGGSIASGSTPKETVINTGVGAITGGVGSKVIGGAIKATGADKMLNKFANSTVGKALNTDISKLGSKPTAISQAQITQQIKPKTDVNIPSIPKGKTTEQIINSKKPDYGNISVNEFLSNEPELKPNWTPEEIAQANQNTRDFLRGTYTPEELNAAEVPYIIDSISKNTGLSPQEALNYLNQNTKLVDKSINTIGHFNPVFQPEVGIDPTPNLPSSFTFTSGNTTPMDTWRHEVGGHLATHSAQYPAMYNRNLDFSNLIKNEFNNEVLRQTPGGKEWLKTYGKDYVNESLPFAMESLGYKNYQVPNETILNHYKNVNYNADLNPQDVLNLRQEIENRVSDYYTDAMLRSVDTSYYNQIPNYFKGLGIDYNLPNY